MEKIYALATTHFDLVWMWPYEEALSSIRATLKSALDRMDEYPEFVYSFSNPYVFEQIEQIDPDLFKNIQKRVAEGRWELNEGWLCQPDCNLPIGESFARQGLYGQRYLKKTFGVYSETAFNTDSFGHNAALPQLLKKCGIKNYFFMRPNKKEKTLPSLFIWRGLDGSEITAYRFFNEYIDDHNDVITAAKNSGLQAPAIIYGVTDHGGAPTKKAIEFFKKHAQLSTVSDYMKQVRAEKTIEGELQGLDFGVYFNLPEVKINNRKCEYILLNAEKAAVWAGLKGKKYPKDKIRELWKGAIFNQFHDIIGGTCTKDVYFKVRNHQGAVIHGAEEILHASLQYIAREVNCPGKYWNLVLFNLNSCAYEGYIEAEVQWAWEFDWYKGGIYLTDDEGNKIECQIVTEKSALPGFRSRFVFRANIPAHSYKTYQVQQSGNAGREDTSAVAIPHSLEKPEIVPVIFDDSGDTWCFNMEQGYSEDYEIAELIHSEIVEWGNLKKTIKYVFRYNDSVITEYCSTYDGERYADFRIVADWREKHKALKLKIDCKSTTIKAGIPYGSIVRENNGRENIFSEWILTDQFIVASDSIFSYHSCPQKKHLYLSILRSAIYADLRFPESEQNLDHREYDYMSQGIEEFRFRISDDTAQCPETFKQNAVNPPVTEIESLHPTQKGGAEWLTSGCPQGVTLAVLKKPEEGEQGIVCRFAELDGERKEFVFTFSGLGKWHLILKPFEIKTVLLTEGQCAELNILEEYYEKI